ncbi:EF-hand domain-containing protein [Sphingomonas parva]|uniref:EF-hand domain-containing protein n=1 Tax=Sphingomonas parva TaxID=2555898 RepID=A0A4Y8ZR47_9SPHN|nr:EF-hand domain-containing protein [Sphingomonas parva]TFI58500.1 EF-hand domain-containing protein [Sphingomonas parva]
MTRKKTLLLAGGGVAGVLAAAAAAFALAPERGPGAADLNRDGQITAAEIGAAAAARFAEADANKDGRLTGDELPRRGRGHHRGAERDGAAPTAGIGPGAGPVAAAPRRPGLDADGDGTVTPGEFEQGFRRRLGRADSNGDGTISAAELAAAREKRRGHGRH